jgi:uncharacterized protein (DUF983 family)
MKVNRTVSLALRRFFGTVFALRCPVCTQGKIAAGFFGIKEQCPACGARFERGDEGHWLIASTLNYFFNALICIGLTIFLVGRYGFFPGLAWIIVAVALILVALLYRPSKALGLWLLWLFGFVD